MFYWASQNYSARNQGKFSTEKVIHPRGYLYPKNIASFVEIQTIRLKMHKSRSIYQNVYQSNSDNFGSKTGIK